MDNKTALEIINGLAEFAQKSGSLTLDDAVKVKSMLNHIKQEIGESELQKADEEIGGGGIKNPPPTP